jgi:predicted permease
MRPDDELEFHMEMLVRRYESEGLSPEAARQKALARMGDLARARQRSAIPTKESHVNPSVFISSLWRDARYAVRTLRRTPVFTIAALLTLAVGIGATTTIFSVVHAVLLRGLPYPNADRTMTIFNAYGNDGPSEAAVSPEEFSDIKARTTAFTHLAGIRPQISALTDDCLSGICDPVRVNAYAVSPNLFDLLGVQPQTGRTFSAADGKAGADAVVVLSDSLWQLRYGGDPAIVGRTITVAGRSRLVIGVMPAGMRFPDEPVSYLQDKADLWIPVAWEDVKDGRGNQYLAVVGLRDGNASEGQARADLARIGETFKAEFPSRYAEPRVVWALGAASLTEAMVGDVQLGIVVLFGAVGCVLLIACANVANLSLARGATRRREMAVRSALGAGRRRLIQQLLIETLLVTAGGAALGVAVAALGLNTLLAVNPGGIPRIELAEINTTVLLFAIGLAAVTGLVVGLLPALRQAQADPQQALGDSARGDVASAPRRGLRGVLVVAEVALAVVVMTGAALLIRSYMAVTTAPLGISGDGVAVARLSLNNQTYDTPDRVFGFHQQMRGRLGALPGISQVSAVYPLPLGGEGWSGSVGIVGLERTDDVPEPHAELSVALPGYFDVMGIPLVDGRDFSDADSAGAPEVAIVDTVFAATYFPNQRVVGQRIAVNGNVEEGPFQTIVGVVGHVRRAGARVEGEGHVYRAALQKRELSLYFLASTTMAPSSILPSVRTAVRAQDSRLPIAQLTTMDDVTARFTARDRFNTLLFTIFGAVAVAIAAIGLYGVLAFLVSQRKREIGIRLALGGRPGHVVRSVVGEGVSLTMAGVGIGLIGAWSLARWMDDMLFGVTPNDWSTYAVMTAMMIVVAVAASLGPARRATRVNPIEVLRS